MDIGKMIKDQHNEAEKLAQDTDKVINQKPKEDPKNEKEVQ